MVGAGPRFASDHGGQVLLALDTDLLHHGIPAGHLLADEARKIAWARAHRLQTQSGHLLAHPRVGQNRPYFFSQPVNNGLRNSCWRHEDWPVPVFRPLTAVRESELGQMHTKAGMHAVPEGM